MHKNAQRIGLIDKLREKKGFSGFLAEKFFDPELKEIMDNLRENVDAPVRAIVSGKSVENADAPEDGLSLKDILKTAEKSISGRKYMVSVAQLSKFHKKMKTVAFILGDFKANLETVHKRFLSKPLSEEDLKELEDLNKRWASVNNSSMIKNAGFLDMIKNLFDDALQNRALAAWEKKYPNRVKKLKQETQTLYKESQALLNVTLNALNKMSKYRSSRKVDDYISEASKIINKFQAYDVLFKNYYESNVKDFLEKPEVVKTLNDAIKSSDKSVIVPPGSDPSLKDNHDLGSEKTIPVQNMKYQLPISPPFAPPSAPVSPQSNQQGVKSNQPNVAPSAQKAPQIPDLPIQTVSPKTDQKSLLTPPKTEDDPDLKKDSGPPTLRSAHRKFIASLEALANESPSFIVAHICKYAASIQNDDPKAAVQLFKIARSIKV